MNFTLLDDCGRQVPKRPEMRSGKLPDCVCRLPLFFGKTGGCWTRLAKAVGRSKTPKTLGKNGLFRVRSEAFVDPVVAGSIPVALAIRKACE
jgi:hypothetical protein